VWSVIASIIGVPVVIDIAAHDAMRLCRQALPKFLSCVDWKDLPQVAQATELLKIWQPVEPSEALALLGSQYNCNSIVRNYAVECLSNADNNVCRRWLIPTHSLHTTRSKLTRRHGTTDWCLVCGAQELVLYLQPLFQALRYESKKDSPLFNFLMSRAMEHKELCYMLYWYLLVEVNQAKKVGSNQNFFLRRFSTYQFRLKTTVWHAGTQACTQRNCLVLLLTKRVAL
jgi:phosphatidylinositol 3-kinase